jgi:signal recognition particle receptor subunit beta
MASVNPHTRELVFKLVFYGPGLGGKTTTLQYIHAATKAEHRGKMVSLATPTDRTLYFDFLPIRVPRVRGMAVRLQLFTVPGQVYYAATRKLVLSGADGVVFVADSQHGRTETNQEALDDLHANLAEHNRTLAEVPHTFHWNKRDLAELVPVEDLERRYNKLGAPSLGTVATKGEGVFEGLERITRLVLKSYEDDPKVSIGASADPMSDKGKGVRALPEEGIAQALRDMEEGRAPSRPTHARTGAVLEPPTKISAVVPESGSAADVASGASPSDSPRAQAEQRGGDGSGAWGRFTFPDPATPSSGSGGAATAMSSRPPKSDGEKRTDSSSRTSGQGFSMADMWPESDRESVRQAEAMMAAKDAVNAILACDVLVTRVLASAAGLVGTLDAPRDPAVVALLLGLDGSRYLHFRTAVRAARHREPVTMKDAFEGFTFALEARRARELLRRT